MLDTIELHEDLAIWLELPIATRPFVLVLKNATWLQNDVALSRCSIVLPVPMTLDVRVSFFVIA